MSLEGGKEVGRETGRGLLTWADSLEGSSTDGMQPQSSGRSWRLPEAW